MPIIFKEKNYDRLLLYLKKLIILLIVFLLLISVFNYLNTKQLRVLSGQLQQLKNEELKYHTLIEDHNKQKNETKTETKYYKLLISLAEYAVELRFESLNIKKDRLNISAESINQQNIFNLINSLESDGKFSEVNLINISQKNKYHFIIETLILQQ